MKVLILGRSNVGKSSLFNRIIRRKKALVFNERGITRDILKEQTHWWGHSFEVIDSGGMPEESNKQELQIKVKQKINDAIKEAQAFIFVTDGRAGLHPEDQSLFQLIQKTGKPFTLFVNKIDNPIKRDIDKLEFFALSDQVIAGSAEQDYGIDEAVEWIIETKKYFENQNKKQIEGQVEKNENINFEEQAENHNNASSKNESHANHLKNEKSEVQNGNSDTKNQTEEEDEKNDTNQTQIQAMATQNDSDITGITDATTQTARPKTHQDESNISEANNNNTAYKDVSASDKDKPQNNTAYNKASKASRTTKQRETSIFVIGKANSGKSMLCNQILNQERMIVSSKPGTTLDTITEPFSKNDESFSISDNPGSRRGQREEREKISFAKSRSELDKHDVVLLVIDGLQGPTRQDARLVQLCLEKRKPILVVINKMDLLKKLDEYEIEQRQLKIQRTFHFCEDLPLVHISAKTGYHKDKLFKEIFHIKEKMHFKISTSKLNQFFTKVIKKAPAPVYGNSDVKFYYITQTNKTPPDFIAFANYPKGVHPSYRRFVINQMKRYWGLEGIPIGFHVLPKR